MPLVSCSAKRTSGWLLPKILPLKGFSEPDVPQNSRPSHLKFKQEVNMHYSFRGCWDSNPAQQVASPANNSPLAS